MIGVHVREGPGGQPVPINHTAGRHIRRLVWAVAALALTSACASPAGPTQPGPVLSVPSDSAGTAAPIAPGPGPTTVGGGLVADSVSSALPIQARDVRLVRSGGADLALQFEFANDSAETIAPSDMGLDPRTHVIATLVDLPRGTGYAPAPGVGVARIENASPGHTRASTSSVEGIPPGGSAMVTIVFPAPPEETLSMLVAMDGFLPVETPVQPSGSPALKDDPVLHGGSKVDPADPQVSPVICQSGPDPAATSSTPTRLRLPSDVVFAFGSAALSPAAASAIETLSKQVTATSGSILIEGHTDSIGDDASNQRLSEQRASSVRDAVAARLGSGFQYRTAGFGETRPVAPNTHPDGSDNPDGRGVNRRVELTVETTTEAARAVPAVAREPANTTLLGSGLVPTVRDVRVRGGLALAQVALRNTSDQERALGYLNDGARIGARPDYGGELSLTDGTGARYAPCAFGPAWWDLVATGSPSFTHFGSDKVPPGATAVMWALFAAPPAERQIIQVGVGGLNTTLPAQITGR
jgi:outer membrane protein OmpA-like peptidoglycan-associated protein